MSIDRTEWHYKGDYPQDLPRENSGTHIGFYLTWIIDQQLESEMHRQAFTVNLAAVRNRKMDGRSYLFEVCDEKFTEDELNEEGYEFTEFYYEAEDGGYFEDYEQILAPTLPSIYHVENNWQNYAKIAPVITAAYEAWKKGEGAKYCR